MYEGIGGGEKVGLWDYRVWWYLVEKLTREDLLFWLRNVMFVAVVFWDGKLALYGDLDALFFFFDFETTLLEVLRTVLTEFED